MQAHSNQSEQAAAIPAAAELTQRITSTFDNPEAALVQAQLRVYPPVWDLALDPRVSAALLDAVSPKRLRGGSRPGWRCWPWPLGPASRVKRPSKNGCWAMEQLYYRPPAVRANRTSWTLR